MRCWTGGFDPLHEHEGENAPKGRVNLLDIIMAIGRENRFGNGGSNEYKVLHHSVLVALIYIILFGNDKGVAYALIHDFHEGYMRDLPRPTKMLLRKMGIDIGLVENMYDHCIAEKLGLWLPDEEVKRKIKLCDRIALIIEAPTMGPPGSDCWNDMPAEEHDAVEEGLRKVMPDINEVIRQRSHPGRAPYIG